MVSILQADSSNLHIYILQLEIQYLPTKIKNKNIYVTNCNRNCNSVWLNSKRWGFMEAS